MVLDASVLIAHLDADEALHEPATELLRRCATERLAVSPLTMAEVLVGPARAGRLDEAVTALDRLDVGTIDLRRDAPVRLAVLRARTTLRLPDCCVLLAAGTPETAIATFDERLATAARDLGHRVA